MRTASGKSVSRRGWKLPIMDYAVWFADNELDLLREKSEDMFRKVVEFYVSSLMV